MFRLKPASLPKNAYIKPTRLPMTSLSKFHYDIEPYESVQKPSAIQLIWDYKWNAFLFSGTTLRISARGEPRISRNVQWDLLRGSKLGTAHIILRSHCAGPQLEGTKAKTTNSTQGIPALCTKKNRNNIGAFLPSHVSGTYLKTPSSGAFSLQESLQHCTINDSPKSERLPLIVNFCDTRNTSMYLNHIWTALFLGSGQLTVICRECENEVEFETELCQGCVTGLAFSFLSSVSGVHWLWPFSPFFSSSSGHLQIRTTRDWQHDRTPELPLASEQLGHTKPLASLAVCGSALLRVARQHTYGCNGHGEHNASSWHAQSWACHPHGQSQSPCNALANAHAESPWIPSSVHARTHLSAQSKCHTPASAVATPPQTPLVSVSPCPLHKQSCACGKSSWKKSELSRFASDQELHRHRPQIEKISDGKEFRFLDLATDGFQPGNQKSSLQGIAGSQTLAVSKLAIADVSIWKIRWFA